MNIKKTVIQVIAFLSMALIAVACVKDVDFDQADDLKLEPVFELDFVYSRIQTPKFTNPLDDTFNPVLRDTLQDDFFSGDIGDKLLRVELFVSLESTIPAGFDAELQFLDENNTVIPISTSPIIISVPAGAIGNPQTSEQTYNVTLADVVLLTNAKKLASRVEIIAGTNDLGGELILQSKAIYFTSLLDD